MAKRTIEVNDVLPECVECAIDEVKQALRDHFGDNGEGDVPCLWNDLNDRGAIHEIIDGSVPIYTSDIEAAWFLHGRDLEEAYENAGVGENPRDNDGMAAIYYYIEQKVSEWYSTEGEDFWHDLCSSKGSE